MGFRFPGRRAALAVDRDCPNVSLSSRFFFVLVFVSLRMNLTIKPVPFLEKYRTKLYDMVLYFRACFMFLCIERGASAINTSMRSSGNFRGTHLGKLRILLRSSVLRVVVYTASLAFIYRAEIPYDTAAVHDVDTIDPLFRNCCCCCCYCHRRRLTYYRRYESTTTAVSKVLRLLRILRIPGTSYINIKNLKCQYSHMNAIGYYCVFAADSCARKCDISFTSLLIVLLL